MTDDVLDVATGASDARPELLPFRLDGQDPILYARQPKASLLINMARNAKSTDPEQQVDIIEDFIDSSLTAESAEHLRDRLMDPDDTLDYDGLIPLIEALKERWFTRPTGKPTASSRRRPARGTGSTARARSGGPTPARSRATASPAPS